MGSNAEEMRQRSAHSQAAVQQVRYTAEPSMHSSRSEQPLQQRIESTAASSNMSAA
jgi:hypothetical protein